MTIAFRASSTVAATFVATGGTIAEPTGLASTDLSILLVESKPNSSGTPVGIATPTGWTLIGSVDNHAASGGANISTANDAGNNTLVAFYRVGSGYGATTITVTGGTGNSTGAGIVAFSTTVGSWDTTTLTTSTAWGFDVTSGANGSVTGNATVAYASGEVAVVGAGMSGDVGSVTAETIAATGATFGTYTSDVNVGISTGNDSRITVAHWPVTAGPATAAPVYTWTNASATTGIARFLRVKEASGGGGTPASTTGGGISLGGTAAPTAAVSPNAGGIALGGTGTGRAAATASGAVTLGGSSSTTAPVMTAGTISLGGTVTARAVTTAAGSITLGGTATATQPGSSAAGFITLGGTVTARAAATAGGSITLGSAGTGRAAATATGGISLGGTASAFAAATGFGGIVLGGAVTASVPATAAGLITLSGLANAQADTYVTHTYVTAAITDLSATATLAGNGTSTAALAAQQPATAALATSPPSVATLAVTATSTAALAGDGTSTAALADHAALSSLQTTT